MGVAYIEFGIANPEPYRIMFLTAPDVVPPEYHGKVLADSAAFGMLLRCVQDAIDAGRLRPEYNDAYPTSLGLWARVHGLTSLWVTKPDLPWPGTERVHPPVRRQLPGGASWRARTAAARTCLTRWEAGSVAWVTITPVSSGASGPGYECARPFRSGKGPT